MAQRASRMLCMLGLLAVNAGAADDALLAPVSCGVAASPQVTAAEAAERMRTLGIVSPPDANVCRGSLSSLSLSGPLAYGVFFDAGSSGTRMSVYAWPTRSFAALPPSASAPTEITAVRSPPGVPGVNAPAGRAYISTLLASARSILSGVGADPASTPVFLAATAGLRILDAASRTAAVAELRSTLSSSGFLFRPSWARVLSGEEEAVYGWLAANAAAGALNVTTNTLANVTFGALDLGGASTQITFAPPAGVDMLSDSFTLSLTSAVQANLYAHSFLYLGIDQAARRINEQVLTDAVASNASLSEPVSNPCYYQGFTLEFTSTVTGASVTFNGTGSFDQCFAYASLLMAKSAYCLTDPLTVAVSSTGASAADAHTHTLAGTLGAPVTPLLPINANVTGSTCSIAGTYQPPVMPPRGFQGANVTFLAFSTFSRVWEFLGLPYAAPLTALIAAANASCSTPFSVINSTNNGSVFASGYCLSSSFAAALLSVGYGLPTDSVFVIATPSAQSLSYAPGAMLYYVNALPWLYQSPPTAAATATATIGVGVGLGFPLLLLACVLVCMLTRRAKPTASPQYAVNTPDWTPIPGAAVVTVNPTR